VEEGIEERKEVNMLYILAGYVSSRGCAYAVKRIEYTNLLVIVWVGIDDLQLETVFFYFYKPTPGIYSKRNPAR
jgi:hypothetical protein